MIIIEVIGVLLLIGVLALLILRGGRSRRPQVNESRFKEVGPGEVRTGEKPRATGIN